MMGSSPTCARIINRSITYYPRKTLNRAQFRACKLREDRTSSLGAIPFARFGQNLDAVSYVLTEDPIEEKNTLDRPGRCRRGACVLGAHRDCAFACMALPAMFELKKRFMLRETDLRNTKRQTNFGSEP